MALVSHVAEHVIGLSDLSDLNEIIKKEFKMNLENVRCLIKNQQSV